MEGYSTSLILPPEPLSKYAFTLLNLGKFMASYDSLKSGLKNLLESAKDIPTERIAAVGLTLIGVAATVKEMALRGGKSAQMDGKEKGAVDGSE